MIVDWRNCYDDGWQGMIVPEAFAHPAKFSLALIVRIVKHGLDQGYWKPGDVIGDPFGGVGLGGIVATYHFLRWVGVELEPRFAELANQNFEFHRPRWHEGEHPPQIIQGDSRRFAELVGDVMTRNAALAMGLKGDVSPDLLAMIGRDQALGGVVSSPPYNLPFSQEHNGNYGGERGTVRREEGAFVKYGMTPGQIEGLPIGSLDAVVTSPPWENQEPSHAQGSKFESVHRELHPTKLAKDRPSIFQHEYGESQGQIGRESGETYWQAMQAVYGQMRLAMKPGAVAAIVVKDYVKNKQRVPLCDQTAQLLEHLGFEVFCRCRCWLVKESSHPSLFDEAPVIKTTERKSFFRRLAEKNGSPRIDWEEVILAKNGG